MVVWCDVMAVVVVGSIRDAVRDLHAFVVMSQSFSHVMIKSHMH